MLRAAARLTRPVLVDVALVLGGLLLLVDRAFFGVGVPRDISGSPEWAVPLLALAPLSLSYRRRAPVVTVLAVTLAPAVHGIVAGKAAEGAFLLLPVAVGLYSLGAYGSFRQVAGGLMVAVVGETVATAKDPNALQTSSERWAWAFWLCVQIVIAVVGVFVAARRRENAARRQAQEARRTAAAETQAAVTEERARIARELHDVVTHHLNVVVLHATAADAVVDSDRERVRTSLRAIEGSGREALVEMRRLLGVLRDTDFTDTPPLAPQPRLSRLPDLVADARSAGVDVTLTVDRLDALDDGVQLAIYRIVQESLSNVMKHAAGARVVVAIHRHDDQVVVAVDNSDGHAALPIQSGGGNGLVGMKERVGVFGGQLTVGACPGGGFRVHASLPVAGTTTT